VAVAIQVGEVVDQGGAAIGVHRVPRPEESKPTKRASAKSC
jgi:hypothetical protein